jgi:hypothetical protein
MTTSTSMKGRQIASEVDLIGLRLQLRVAEPRISV